MDGRNPEAATARRAAISSRASIPFTVVNPWEFQSAGMPSRNQPTTVRARA